MPLLIPPKNVVAGDLCILVDPQPEEIWRVVVVAECASISSHKFHTDWLSTSLYGKVCPHTLGGYDYRRHCGPPLNLDLSRIRLLGVMPGDLPLGKDNFECIKFMRRVVRRHKQEILR